MATDLPITGMQPVTFSLDSDLIPLVRTGDPIENKRITSGEYDTSVVIGTNPGQIEGYVVSFSVSAAVAISSGSCVANGKRFLLADDTPHTMTSLASGFDIHYIYIDDSASTAPTAVFIDSITEPTFDAAKRGWYNGDDRMIGLVSSTTGAATIIPFETVEYSGKLIRISWGQTTDAQWELALNMNPTGAWQVPNTRESSTNVSVNAVEINLNMFNLDAGALGAVAASSLEYSVLETSIVDGTLYYEWFVRGDTTKWIPLGVSRNVRIGGTADDDNLLRAITEGYGYTR